MDQDFLDSQYNKNSCSLTSHMRHIKDLKNLIMTNFLFIVDFRFLFQARGAAWLTDKGQS